MAVFNYFVESLPTVFVNLNRLNSMNHYSRSFSDRANLWLKRLSVAGIALLAGCSVFKPVDLLNAVVPSSGYALQSDIVYGDESRQKLDIYFPTKRAAQSRIIVFVYGGAWRQGKRAEYEFVGQALADAGHTVIIPDYRLYPSVVYPEFIKDIADAMVAAKEIIEQRSNTTMDQVVVMGHSSGAHTAAMLASDPQWLEGSGITPSALIGIAGPYDLPLDDPEVKPVFRTVSDADDVRPVALVTSRHPPALLIHGEVDKRVLPFHTRRYSAALTAAGVPVDVHWLKGEGHVSSISGIAAPLDRKNQNRMRITDFLDNL